MNPRQAEEARAVVDKLYRAIQQQWPEFEAREGQRHMIGAVLDTMLNARTKATPCDGANLALIEAPTGTGKTLSYLLAAYAASVVLDKKVIVSTATVALQEQLHSKDLPRLAALAGADFTFDLLKGRQRYVCRRKLDRTDPLEDEGLFDQDEQRSAAGSSERLVRELHEQLQSGRWSGDRDEWAQGVDDATWRSIEADRHSCQGRKCSAFKDCAFYTARKRAEGARIHVANHALVLTTLSTESNLIDPGNTLFVFDEGHHLAQVGVERFTTEVSLAGLLRACERARTVLPKAARAMPGAPWSAQVEATGPLVREAEQTIARLLVDLDEDPSADKRGVVRFAEGKLPASWQQTIEHLGALLASGHGL
ncbi:MAG: DEAD/DEAH box helicase family protein, partial [Aquabacterium sp.]|nr:DEAD/DEAH box helicase family protein [Aquabacterium sp.]